MKLEVTFFCHAVNHYLQLLLYQLSGPEISRRNEAAKQVESSIQLTGFKLKLVDLDSVQELGTEGVDDFAKLE